MEKLTKEEAVEELLIHTDLSCKDCGGVERERCPKCDKDVKLNIKDIISRIDTPTDLIAKVEECMKILPKPRMAADAMIVDSNESYIYSKLDEILTLLKQNPKKD